MKKVVWVKENPKKAEVIRLNGYERVQDFTWDRHVERIVDAMKKEIKDNPGKYKASE